MRVTSLAWALVLTPIACKDGGGDTGDATTTATTTATTGAAEPTTTAATTTAEPTTAPATGETTGVPPAQCSGRADEAACAAAPGCVWDDVILYTHDATGCHGTTTKYCVAAETSGEASTWYRGAAGEEEVLQFGHTPGDLPSDLQPCDCDGPLACLCTLNAPDCPARYQEFCGAVEAADSCQAATINGQNLCNWFRVFPEGPADDACENSAFKQLCLYAENAAADTCTKIDLTATYPSMCTNDLPPVYWRILDGIVEVTSICGPVPPSPEWTACSATDTPAQPDECKCACT